MLEYEPKRMGEEVQAAERLRDDLLASLPDQISFYAGPKRKRGEASHWHRENYHFSYLSLMAPRLVHDNPRVRVRSRRPGVQESVAEAIEHALNRLARDSGLRSLLQSVVFDYLLNWGVFYVTVEPQPGMSQEIDDPLMWPVARRLSPRDFFVDPLARRAEEARYMGHRFVVDKKMLEWLGENKADEGWDRKVIMDLKGGEGTDEYHKKGQRSVESPDRDEIVLREVWVPEAIQPSPHGPREGFHGTIFTIVEGSSDWVRKPRPYWGPRWGPYVLVGCYTVPDEPYPLSALVAASGQIEDLNDHVEAESRSAELYKRVIVTRGSAPKLQQIVAKGSHDYVYDAGTDDVRDSVASVEVGGTTPQMSEAIARRMERCDRNLGIHEVQRGNASTATTATAVSVAEEASNARLGFIIQQFRDGVARLERTLAWFVFHDDQIVLPLGEGYLTGYQDPFFQGGQFEEGSGATFEDLELEIEPYSMERTSEGLQQRRALQLIPQAMQLAQAAPMMPWFNVTKAMEMLGEAFNVPDFGDLISEEMLALAAQTMPLEQNPEMVGEPRVGKDVGSEGMVRRFQAGPFGPGGAAGGGQRQGAAPQGTQGPQMARSAA